MAQRVAQDAEPADRAVQLVGLRREHGPVDAGLPVRAEHQRDLVEGEARRAAQSAPGTIGGTVQEPGTYYGYTAQSADTVKAAVLAGAGTGHI